MSLERLSRCLTPSRFSASYLTKISPSTPTFLTFPNMFLPYSGAPSYTTSNHRRCCQYGRPLPYRQSPRFRQLGALRHLSEKLGSSSSYSVNTRSRRNNATRTNQHLEDAERSPLTSDEVPCRLQSGDINIQSLWVWGTRLFTRKSALLPLVERFVHRPILEKFLWFHQGPRSAHELFDTRHRRSGTVYHWTFAALHPYNRSSQD